MLSAICFNLDQSKILLSGNGITVYSTTPPFENTLIKEENVGNQHFLLFPQCFLSYIEQILSFGYLLFLKSANALNSN